LNEGGNFNLKTRVKVQKKPHSQRAKKQAKKHAKIKNTHTARFNAQSERMRSPVASIDRPGNFIVCQAVMIIVISQPAAGGILI